MRPHFWVWSIRFKGVVSLEDKMQNLLNFKRNLLTYVDFHRKPIEIGGMNFVVMQQHLEGPTRGTRESACALCGAAGDWTFWVWKWVENGLKIYRTACNKLVAPNRVHVLNLVLLRVHRIRSKPMVAWINRWWTWPTCQAQGSWSCQGACTRIMPW